MDRINDILNEVANAAGERFGGKKRSDLKNSDFLFPETKSFPIVTPADVPDAISNFGRMKGKMDYGTFLRKLYNMCKRKGPEFVAALPEASKEQLGLKKKVAKAYTGNTDPNMMSDPAETNYYELDRVNMASIKKGDRVRNINSSCKHYGSEGYIEDIESLPDYMGDVVVYKTTNSGKNWKEGDVLKKTRNQLALVRTPAKSQESEDSDEYKNELLEMTVSSLKSILAHCEGILSSLEDIDVKENLTEPWLQGKIAVIEDYMVSIHNFVMFSEEVDDTESSQQEKTPDEENDQYLDEFTPSNSGNKPGLWDNIRKKKEKMGKKYRPAKPGDKDRPDPEQWKKLTK